MDTSDGGPIATLRDKIRKDLLPNGVDIYKVLHTYLLDNEEAFHDSNDMIPTDKEELIHRKEIRFESKPFFDCIENGLKLSLTGIEKEYILSRFANYKNIVDVQKFLRALDVTIPDEFVDPEKDIHAIPQPLRMIKKVLEEDIVENAWKKICKIYPDVEHTIYAEEIDYYGLDLKRHAAFPTEIVDGSINEVITCMNTATLKIDSTPDMGAGVEDFLLTQNINFNQTEDLDLILLGTSTGLVKIINRGNGEIQSSIGVYSDEIDDVDKSPIEGLVHTATPIKVENQQGTGNSKWIRMAFFTNPMSEILPPEEDGQDSVNNSEGKGGNAKGKAGAKGGKDAEKGAAQTNSSNPADGNSSTLYVIDFFYNDKKEANMNDASLQPITTDEETNEEPLKADTVEQMKIVSKATFDSRIDHIDLSKDGAYISASMIGGEFKMFELSPCESSRRDAETGEIISSNIVSLEVTVVSLPSLSSEAAISDTTSINTNTGDSMEPSISKNEQNWYNASKYISNCQYLYEYENVSGVIIWRIGSPIIRYYTLIPLSSLFSPTNLNITQDIEKLATDLGITFTTEEIEEARKVHEVKSISNESAGDQLSEEVGKGRHPRKFFNIYKEFTFPRPVSSCSLLSDVPNSFDLNLSPMNGSPGVSLLIIGMYGGSVVLWNLHTCTLLCNLGKHENLKAKGQGYVSALATWKNKYILSGGHDGSINVYDLSPGPNESVNPSFYSEQDKAFMEEMKTYGITIPLMINRREKDFENLESPVIEFIPLESAPVVIVKNFSGEIIIYDLIRAVPLGRLSLNLPDEIGINKDDELEIDAARDNLSNKKKMDKDSIFSQVIIWISYIENQ